MDQLILLYWLRENGRDAGTPIVAGDLDPAIRGRVLALAAEDAADASGPLELRLPFLDRWDSRRRAEILRDLTFVREGRVIRGIPATRNGVLRDYAATLRATHPAWLGAPGVLDRAYF